MQVQTPANTYSSLKISGEPWPTCVYTPLLKTDPNLSLDFSLGTGSLMLNILFLSCPVISLFQVLFFPFDRLQITRHCVFPCSLLWLQWHWMNAFKVGFLEQNANCGHCPSKHGPRNAYSRTQCLLLKMLTFNFTGLRVGPQSLMFLRKSYSQVLLRNIKVWGSLPHKSDCRTGRCGD